MFKQIFKKKEKCVCTDEEKFSLYSQHNGRKKFVDKKFIKEVEEERFKLITFERLVAYKITFKKVDFSYCVFDAAYLRKCRFIDCIFIGCKFINSNLTQSSFSGCDFRYATFEKTLIDKDVFELNLPKEENLRRLLVRSLRVNYQQIGDTDSVNKAIVLELQATQEHLKKSWSSENYYYRKKYQGFNRLKAFINWGWFVFLDILWGNGESVLKLFRSVLAILICISIVDYTFFAESDKGVLVSLTTSLDVFFGISSRYEAYPEFYKTIILILRLVMFTFFMSVIVKRLNRR